MDEKTTAELMKVLNSAKSQEDLGNYIAQLDTNVAEAGVGVYLARLIEESGLKNSEAFKRAGIERTYGYQILNGTRKPGRDKIVALGLACKFTLKEVQTALAISGEGTLYYKNRRDAVLIYCINQKKSVPEARDLLEGFEFAGI
ncbi:MAG: helix-turn-helix transcriptional regulator [Clostridiales bacterium]|nr:helix-turn-helix transcriptional regulator [Clostridiales bacterium]